MLAPETGGHGARFSPELFRFLRQLERHNERAWFEANRERYERFVRRPMLSFIAELKPRLSTIIRHFVADPSPVGGSMMRIHRDLRFTPDKSPYKTAAAAHFWHEKGKDGASPAFYLHLEPGKCSVGAGIWRPGPAALERIRKAIASRSADWKRITSGREFKSTCGMIGESLKRAPSGFDPDHPLIEDIKRKDFAVSAPLEDREVCEASFLEVAAGGFRKSAPLVRFLCEAVGLPF